ncbi:MFS transporter [Acuticoccus sediminis]|uniref:MFS transporter n=1 Tax=Acuticoccus sediminis TaxID=2184697 RepID=A0A8B2NMR9_9HYPH|nr:MFS transporter [Acuticoccus sediminis]RAH96773.1 MFS transporter [Acuticoccus sediminis]
MTGEHRLDGATGVRPAAEKAALSLTVVSAATALVLIVFTIPLTTMSATSRMLAMGPSGEAWLLSAMPLGAATGLLGAAALGDDHGRRLVFLWGLGVMAAASVLGAVATTSLVLIVARIVQGLGGAAVMACGLGLVGRIYPEGRARATAAGVWAAGLGAGVAIGPILASCLTGLGGWTASYWANAILSAGLLVAGHVLLPPSEPRRPQPADWLGTILLMAGLAMFMAALTEMRFGIARPTVILLLAGGLAVLGAFAVVELRHPRPILELHLFRSPAFSGATIAAFASGAGVLALMSLVPTMMMRAMQATALDASLVLTAWSATSVVTALCARWLPETLTPRVLLVGGLIACGVAQMLLFGRSPDGSALLLLPGLFLAGAANGVLNAALGRQAVATVPADRVAMGSGANNTARYLGSAIGITVGAVLMAHGADVDGVDGLLSGWNEATLITTGFSLLGAITVAVARDG